MTRIPALGLLTLVAGAPFVLAVCAPHEAAPVAPPPPPPPESLSVAPPPNPPDSTPSAVASTPPVASSSAPPWHGRIPKDCAALDRAISATFHEGSCKADLDCTVGYGWCTCGDSIATSSFPKLEALNSAFEGRECYSKLPPRPCPKCLPSPPIPKCLRGKCQ